MLRIATKLQIESDRVHFMLKTTRDQFLDLDPTIIENLFKDMGLDAELEQSLCALYNIFSETNFEWLEIYDSFDLKKFIPRIVFAQSEKFKDSRITELLEIDFRELAKNNIRYKRAILILYQLLILYEIHFKFYSKIERINVNVSSHQKQHYELEKQEIDLRMKISNINSLIETIELKSQLVEEEITANEVEHELKKSILDYLKMKARFVNIIFLS